MKITIPRTTLLQGLQRVQNIISSSAYLPCLSNVVIEAKDNTLILTTSDVENTIQTQIECDVKEEGITTLPGKKLVAIVKELDAAEVLLEKKTTKEEIHITAGNSYFKLLGLPASEFPKLPTLENPTKLEIEQATFKTAIIYTLFATSTDETRFVLNGALLEVKDSRISLVTTDGKRLSCYSCDSSITTEVSEIIPTKTLQELSRLLVDEPIQMEIEISKNLIRFKTPAFQLTSKLIDGKYPEYQRVIPTNIKSTFEVSREELLTTVKRVSLVSENTEPLKITYSSGKMNIAASTTTGEAKEDVSISYTGEDVVIGYNHAYLLDMLKHINEETVKINLVDAVNPTLITSKNYLYVLMPMRIN